MRLRNSEPLNSSALPKLSQDWIFREIPFMKSMMTLPNDELVHTAFSRTVADADVKSPPNIVVYLSDDHSQFDSSLYGNANIPTPQFERLAADGITLSHAFVASPSCRVECNAYRVDARTKWRRSESHVSQERNSELD